MKARRRGRRSVGKMKHCNKLDGTCCTTWDERMQQIERKTAIAAGMVSQLNVWRSGGCVNKVHRVANMPTFVMFILISPHPGPPHPGGRVNKVHRVANMPTFSMFILILQLRRMT